MLSHFERRLESAVEGFFARAFRSALQPVELAKALRRYAEDNQHVTEAGVIVPNLYRFLLNPRDVERLATLGDRLKRDLAEAVAQAARERGWRLRGPVVVRIEESDEVRFGTYELAGRVESVSLDATGAVPAFRGKRSESSRERYALRVVRGGKQGAEVKLDDARLLAGRHPDCDIELDDPTVSRQHAAFVRRGGDWWVIDLESTNGTRVNGADATEHVLQPGDRIELGQAVVELVEV
ncbi:MAG: DUF3662 domain-containing protein [Actinomycetota bacterium]|nr:DUF3662 domain-containing protein [Actinomycetota bacterium]